MDNNLEQFARLYPNRDTREEAVEYAKAYVEDHRAELDAELGDFTLAELVDLVSISRRAGHDEQRLKIDAWLLGQFPKQQITGAHGQRGAD